MNTLKRLVGGALLSGGVALASVGLITNIAAAQPAPAPLNPAWPGCPPDSPQGPCRWCPGQAMPPTGNQRTNPVRWDNGVCHTYYYVNFGTGNVASNIWDGPNPPPLAGH